MNRAEMEAHADEALAEVEDLAALDVLPERCHHGHLSDICPICDDEDRDDWLANAGDEERKAS